MTLFTFLVKSEKYGKICLGCLDENKRWIRPIKPGGFVEKDILMDNGKMINLFDVVDTKFGAPFLIKHHKENMKFPSGTRIKFVKNLDETEQSALLTEIANAQLLKKVESKYELYDEILLNLGRSIVLVGPIGSFDIQYNCGNHPRLWIVGKNNCVFDIRCTDIKFCAFIKSKLADFGANEDSTINSQNVAELKGKQIYFVIGLTGDSLDENNEIKNGKFAPDGMEPRYWPMVVSILTVPNYLNEG